MMISAEKLHEYSNELYQNNNKSEVILRSAARVAYYALYHKLISLSCSPQGGKVNDAASNCGAHEKLIQQLRISDKDYLREWGISLSRLKSVRNKADYKLDTSFSDHDAYSTVRKVGKLLDEIDAIEKDADIKVGEEKNLPITDEVKNNNSSNIHCSNSNSVDKEAKPKKPTLRVIK
ncbi:hypothetical protein [Aeromonas salmonicida]|uniref:hypothetical protein n=1 Tax=Aeromonas salmonicida TaxID=645 RepID=UPI00232E743C|nr:hypothetical protein [Aeromonas salmonicida]WCH28827.1 hypothetical protein ONZ66_08535 [Aeromonas salmonicida]